MWKPGDLAVIDCIRRDGAGIDGQYCTLRRRYDDGEGGNDFFYENKVIPNAWIVQLHDTAHVDCRIVAESALVDTRNPMEKDEWAHGPWQPTELVKYP